MLQKQRFFTPAETDVDPKKLKLTASSAKARLALNESFFAQSFPELHKQIKTPAKNRYRTFYTKFANLNLLDEQTHQLFYEAEPRAESERSALNFLHSATTMRSGTASSLQPLLNDDCKLFKGNQDKAFKVTSIHKSADVIVVLGLGLGFFMETLLTQSSAKAIIVYEKNIDMVRASMEVLDWQGLFQLATDNGIALFFQAGNNGDSLKNDLQELSQALPFEQVSYYRHYPDFDYDRNFLAQLGKKLPASHSYNVPVQACLDIAPGTAEQATEVKGQVAEQKQRSFKLLEKQKPHMADFLNTRTLKRWQAYVNQHGQLNALDCVTGWPLFSDNRDVHFFTERLDEIKNFHGTYRSDGAATKSIRVNYRYYQLTTQFSDSRQNFIDKHKAVAATKPMFSPSVLINGIGLGYEFAYFIEHEQINELRVGVLLEPDEELLLLSLHASNWLEKLAVHIDLQEDFTFLLDDPREGYKQSFSAVYYTRFGAAVASSLYFTSTPTDVAKEAIKAFLHGHQQTLFAATYDDNRFHINHAVANLNHGAKVLNKRVQDKKTPIILVGNGPSLDQNMEWIKRNKDHSIIVSCGTSIYTLYKAGIVPDFHSEIEIVKVVAEMKTNMPSETVKSIDLLATISAHPMLSEIFNQAYLITRGGLEVTEHLKLLGAIPNNVIETRDGAPTCVNLAACVFAEAGYQNLILCGVDLAARDDGKHHASQSYYDDESLELLHGFSDKENASEHLLVEGFDGSQMLSKGEFIFAIDALGQLFSRFPGLQVTNLSRGAKIPSSRWQDDQSFELVSASLDKAQFKKRFSKSFTYVEKPKELYSAERIQAMIAELETRIAQLDADVASGKLGLFDYYDAFRQQVKAVKNDPAQLMVALFTRSSRFFESQVYAFATFSYERTDDSIAEASSKAFSLAYTHWKQFYTAAINDIKEDPYQLENSSLKDNKMLAGN